MKILSAPSPALYDFEPSAGEFFDELFLGLSQNPKSNQTSLKFLFSPNEQSWQWDSQGL